MHYMSIDTAFILFAANTAFWFAVIFVLLIANKEH